MFTTDDIVKTTSKFDEVISSKPRPRDPSASPNAYQNLSVVKKITKGKFPIYLTSSKINKQNYAMKIFCHDRKGPQMYYQNEIRFASLKHPNIIDMVYYENEKGIVHKGELKKVSYILTEYAPHGDFFDLAADFRDHFDDKLARTYFRQLIEGIEYLHKNDIAHLDLKPENLLLGADFNLKIADFDLSHKDGDAMLLGRGTRNYRAPEFFEQTLHSGSSLADLFAADIYSAGIILFILKSGMYPHAEYHLLEGVSFVDLMYGDNQKFWVKHCEVQERETSFFSAAFKELFNGMVKANPKERLTIKEIKASMWYNGPIYTPAELANKMKSLLYC